MTGFEPVTSSLPRKHSTPELHRPKVLSGRRDSNPQHSAWKAEALPIELLPHLTFYQKKAVELQIYNYCFIQPKEKHSLSLRPLLKKSVGREGFEPPKSKDSRFTVCPRWPLEYLPNFKFKSLQRDSNPRPADYKSAALAN